MLQTLDLARENAALKREVARLRQEVARLARARRYSRLVSMRDGRAQTDTGGDEHARERYVLIVPRSQTHQLRLPASRAAGLPCEVIVDRRVMDRRRRQTSPPPVERRRCERRGVNGFTSSALVIAVAPRHSRR